MSSQVNSIIAFVGWAVPTTGTNFGVNVNYIKATAFGGRVYVSLSVALPTLHVKQVLSGELGLNIVLHRQALNDSLRHV